MEIFFIFDDILLLGAQRWLFTSEGKTSNLLIYDMGIITLAMLTASGVLPI